MRLQRIETAVFKRICLAFILINLCGCAFFPKAIGEKRHTFDQRPTKIVWIQIPGLSVNHFSLSKLAGSIMEQSIPLESVLCTGRAWNYSLFEVGPQSSDTIQSQLSGSRNSKKKCSERQFLWKDLLRFGFTSGVLLRDVSGASTTKNPMCYESNLNDIVLWRSAPTKNLAVANELKFHHQERKKQYYLNTTYYDKSCDGGTCHSEFEKNIRTLYEDFFSKREFHFLSVQDFTYLNYVKTQDYAKAKEYLQSLLKVIEYFKNKKRDDLLLLMTFVDPIEMVLPPSGKSWKRILDKVSNHPAKLHTEVLAWGAGSEKFCGIYHTSDLKNRILRAVASE